MSEGKSINLLKAAKELNIGLSTAVEFLGKKGHKVEPKPNTKLTEDMYDVLLKEFQGDKIVREEAKQISIGKIRRDDSPPVTAERPENRRSNEFDQDEILIKNAGTFASQTEKPKPVPTPVVADQPENKENDESTLPGVKVVGKIDLNNLHPRRPEKPAEAEKPVVEEKPVEAVKEDIPAPVQEPEPVKPVEVIAEAEAKPEAVQPPAAPAPTPEPVKAPEQPVAEKNDEEDVIRARAERLSGPNVVGRITLPVNPPRRKDQPVASSSSNAAANDHKRKRKRKDQLDGPANQQGQQQTPQPGNNRPFQPGNKPFQPGGNQQSGNRPDFRNRSQQGGGQQGNSARPDFRNRSARPDSGPKEEPSEKEIQDQIKATLARLSGAGKSGKFAQRAKLRRQKRDDVAQSAEEAALEREMQSKVLKVTEFVTANELASMMDVSVTQIISTCMSLGMFVSINQRLDAETLTIVADEFGYQVDFVKPTEEEINLEEEDEDDDLLPRAPIVTVMGHVDHGKTSLLDFIRKTNVISGEAGGITQHIGAYEVKLEDGRKITFLDTPGHEAFTAMRARGAQATDIAIIVIAADDSVMPQTREAINHAQAAGVPIVFAFNKIDKPGANPDKVREQLSAMNILVEEWGGKYQTQEISAKSGLNIDLLLEKVLLEAEILDLKANPNKRAVGTVIEAALDKGRGIVTTVLIQAGTLRVGDPILAGCYSGRVKALSNERGQKVDQAGPSTPVQVLGMQGAPTAGDKFNAMESEPEAREIANKRLQLQREQGLRTQKHITLDEIGRRLAIGNFKELNIIVKGDVDGSIEALSDSLLKLSTQEIQVNIIHKSVGQISESDVLLASASDAIIIGFQVRPSSGARKLAEQEEIDIRLYSIIYDAINEVKAAMEGMLAPEFEEKIVANVEIRETFKITKVGTIAGCMVLDGKITRNSKIRIVRDGVVVYTGELASLKRYKDDVKEVSAGYECGLNINNFNNIEVGDIVEAYEQVEVKRKL
ncbi:translation initiation factor IF-2 [Pedobacter sp. HMF7647]|uniref:Translation initiation factor IF-2 n=1 Tax=Hufsiella arboris TaxID=2695275 RepID=A0A7K1Y7A6_9SPHI|nr:translation initiation factor IF-2 [Hufsiella arboris]MXV50009.1 translation initiation factor IF-2 [Hufsiella arboris]